MSTQNILDSHIHLWPQSAANAKSHSWMQLGEQLTKQYSIQDYLSASSSNTSTSTSGSHVRGFVYVETDRTVQSSESQDVQIWAEEPLREIAFLRRIVEGTPEEGEGFDASHSHLLKGIVAWAPLDRGITGFQQYLSAAREIAGEETWKRIRGCRYLVQGIKDRMMFDNLVKGNEFIDLLRLLGEEGWSFDVGVDQHSGGIWQLFNFGDTIIRAHEGVETKDKTVFILGTSASWFCIGGH
jgi:L-rhamnono-1,4-lactonase